MTGQKIDLGFIARQRDSILAELRTMREDMTVMVEILRRAGNDVSSIGTQLTDMHAYNRRVEQRVHKLEDART